MNDLELATALIAAAEESLRAEYRLMDDHHLAPGCILFAIDGEKLELTGRYIAYLVYKTHEESTLPMIYAFELTEAMDADKVKLALQEAQDKFTAEVRNLQRMAQKRVTPVQGQDVEPALWNGGALDHWGKNPCDQPVWRVIWAPTRMYLVGGRWEDRKEGKIVRTVDEYRWIPRYGEDDGWILEKWLSALEYAGTKEAWDMQNMDAATGLEELGPYPARGEYESVWKFPAYPTASEVERVIQMVRYGKEKYSQADIREAHRKALEGKEKDRGNNLEAMVRDAMPAFPLSGMSGSPNRSGLDPLRLTTKDLPSRMPKTNKDFRQVN